MNAAVVLAEIALFVCATFAFKALLDAFVRLRMLRVGVTEASLRALIESDVFQRRSGALRSGIALLAMSIGAALIELFGWREITPGAVAAVVAPMGVGELIFYFISQRGVARVRL